ncbi:MAG: hypothetical protein KAR35_06600 [Candidatus Heimdallarchaeota archaeon]|nr:hypothetical protein [Candidatus Heimdallarchaeota archaeon]MCK5049028.1 hypothetical protein [Candidatus Heimdallarchaeota archaeon]
MKSAILGKKIWIIIILFVVIILAALSFLFIDMWFESSNHRVVVIILVVILIIAVGNAVALTYMVTNNRNQRKKVIEQAKNQLLSISDILPIFMTKREYAIKLHAEESVVETVIARVPFFREVSGGLVHKHDPLLEEQFCLVSYWSDSLHEIISLTEENLIQRLYNIESDQWLLINWLDSIKLSFQDMDELLTYCLWKPEEFPDLMEFDTYNLALLEFASAAHTPISRTGTDVSSSLQEQQGQADYLFLHKILSGYFVEISMLEADELPLVYSPETLQANFDLVWSKFKEKGSFLTVVKELGKPPIMVKQIIELGKEKEKEESDYSEQNEEEIQLENDSLNFKDFLYNEWENSGEEIYELSNGDKENVEFLLWKAYQPYFPKNMLKKLHPWENLGAYSRFVMLSIAFLELFASLDHNLKRMKTNIRFGIWKPDKLDGGKITEKQLNDYSTVGDEANSLGLNINNLTLSDLLVLKEKSIKLLTMKTISCVANNWEKIIKNTAASPDLWSEDVKEDVIEISEPLG